MQFATLISWLVTASLGGFMLRTWLARDGLRRERSRAGGLPPQLIFGHAAGAITGLLAWAGYVATGARPFAWTAVGLLVIAVGLGLCTVTLWTPYPARRPGDWRIPRDPRELVIPDTPAAAVEAVAAADARYADAVAGRESRAFEVTDEMIAQLFSEPAAARRHAEIRLNPAVIIPIAHGFMAIATFVLAVMSAAQ